MLKPALNNSKTIISEKNTSTVIVLGVILLIVYFILSFISLRNIITTQDASSFHHAENLHTVSILSRNAEQMIARSQGYLMLGEEAMLVSMNDSRQDFSNTLKTLKERMPTQKGKALLKKIESIEVKHQSALNEIIQKKRAGAELNEIKSDFLKVVTPIRNRLYTHLAKLESYQKKLLNNIKEQSARAARRSMSIILGMGLFSLVAVPFLGLLLLRTLNHLRSLKHSAEASSERFLDLVNHLDHSIVWEATANPFAFSFVSERSQYVLGRSADEWIEQAEAFFVLIPSEEQAKLKTQINKALTTLEDVRLSHRMKNTDGDIIWVQTGIHPKKFADGSIRLYGLTMDITPLRLTKEQLQKTQEQFTSIMENAPFSIYIKDQDGRYTFCNRKTLKVLNKSKDEIIGKRDEEFMPREIALEITKLDQRVLDEKKSLVNEEDIFLNEKMHTFYSIKFPIRDDKGEVYAICGISNDITARRQAEEALRSSEERLALALEGSGLGVWDWNLKSNQLIWNDNTEKILHYSASDGKHHFSDFTSRVHPEDLARINQALSFAIDNKTKFRAEFRIVWPDKKIRSVLSIGRAIYDESGSPCRMVGIIHDITIRKRAENELQESQQRLQSILDHSPSSIFLKDLEGRIVIANKQFAKVFKRPLKDLIGKTNYDLVPPVIAQSFEQNDKIVIDSRKTIEIEEVAELPDGTHTFISAKFPVYNSEGEIKYLGGIATDISDRKKFEKSLQEAVRVREEVLAIVSHDLRNPLGVMMVGAALIERKSPDDEFGKWVKNQAQRIHKGGQKMNALIEDLLSLAKIEAGHFTLNKSPYLITQLLDEAMEFAQAAASEKEILIKKVSQIDGHTIDCDGAQISRVFSNLISNAIKFTPQEGMIILEAKTQSDEVIFSVTDTGPGIAEHHLPNVFDRFWQAQNTAHKGTGLGLAIAKGIIESHNGRIMASSQFGEGATFSFCLPLNS